jgi:IPT/TIG domain
MNSHHNFRRNRNGIGTVFGMVFFLLIVMLVFSSLMIVLNQNTGLEQATIAAKQFDLDRYVELQTISITNPQVAVLNSVVYISCTITNTGTLPAELVRLWIKDNTTDTVGNTIMAPSIILQPGNSIQYFNSSRVANAGFFDMFSFWFISTRGNTISAYPNTNQLSGIAPVGTFPGVADMNSTYQTNVNNPLQLSLKTTKPNQLIYVVVSYDDGNTLYTPTSTPSLTWTLRGTSLATDHNSGDSILKTFYAIMPTVGSITINIHSTADELSDYYCSALAFAISDVNTASPFDGSAQTTIDRSTMPKDTINTHYSNDFIIGAIGIDDLNPAITPGAGFGQIMPVQSSFGASGERNSMPRSVWSEWAIMGDPKNNLPVNCTFPYTEDWAIIVDAVRLVVVPPTAPMSLSPSSGPIGQPVTVSGQGFAANSQLIATFDGSQIPFSFTTDSTGNIPLGATFTVPQSSTAGSKTVNIIDNKFNYASATFTVKSSITIISPVSATGPGGSSVTLSGSGFGANSALTATFSGVAVILSGTTSTTSTGSFAAAIFTVPSQTEGSKTVTFSDSVTPTHNTAFTTFTLSPTVTLSSTSDPVGTTITLSGSNFAASSRISVKYDGSTLTTSPATVTTSSSGVIPLGVTFTVPASSAGIHTVTVTDASSNIGSATFSVISTITLSPTSGNVGTTVTVSGTGFAVSSTITLTYDGAVLTYPATNSVGSFSATFAAPVSVAGSHTIQASDGTNTGSATFTITSIFVLSPSSGTVSSSVTVSGSGFKANAQVTITLGGSTIATIPTPVTTGSTGSFTASFMVPSGSITGSIAGAKTIQANDGTNSASTTFTVLPAITLSSTSGNVGSVVTVSGTGYAATSTITLKYDVTTQTTSPTTVTTTNFGTISCTFTVSASIAGLHTVTATDASTNAAAATFTVVPVITLNPTTGSAGSTVTVSGTGFGGSKSITVTFNAAAVTLSGTTSTGATGSFTGATFTVPTSTAGVKTVAITDASSNAASAAFTIGSSIALSPTLGEVGTSVTVSGAGFAANSVLTATFVGSSLTLSGTTSTDATGSFSGSTFIVPTSLTGPQTVIFSDSATPTPNTVQTIFTVTVAITVTSSPAGTGFIQVDTVAITTPTTFHWVAGNSHTISAQSPVSGGTGIQYIYTGWSDSGTQTHTYVVPGSSTTVTASYKTQYQVTFAASSNADGDSSVTIVTVAGNPETGATLPYTAWYDSGSSLSYAFVGTVASSSSPSNTQYVWSSTTGLSQTLQTNTFTVTGTGTVTGTYTS